MLSGPGIPTLDHLEKARLQISLPLLPLHPILIPIPPLVGEYKRSGRQTLHPLQAAIEKMYRWRREAVSRLAECAKRLNTALQPLGAMSSTLACRHHSHSWTC